MGALKVLRGKREAAAVALAATLGVAGVRGRCRPNNTGGSR
jgi:hypothetical protein